MLHIVIGAMKADGVEVIEFSKDSGADYSVHGPPQNESAEEGIVRAGVGFKRVCIETDSHHPAGRARGERSVDSKGVSGEAGVHHRPCDNVGGTGFGSPEIVA